MAFVTTFPVLRLTFLWRDAEGLDVFFLPGALEQWFANSVILRIMPIELQKKSIPFHFTDWLIGIFIMASYNPYITGKYNSLYTLKNPIGVVKKTPLYKSGKYY